MDFKVLLIGSFVGAFVFGAYFLGTFRGPRASSNWREFLASVTEAINWKGLLWAFGMPMSWLLVFYTYVVHVRISLGKWPYFGQHLEGWSYAIFDKAVRMGAQALVSSLYFLPVFLIGCMFLRRWRFVSAYAIAFGTGMGIAFGAMFLAPHAFLNWFFD